MQLFLVYFIYFCKTLYMFQTGFSVHLQELKTAHTESGICQTITATCCQPPRPYQAYLGKTQLPPLQHKTLGKSVQKISVALGYTVGRETKERFLPGYCSFTLSVVVSELSMFRNFSSGEWTVSR